MALVLAVGIPAPLNAACFISSGQEWGVPKVSFRIDDSVPAAWTSAIQAAAQTWNDAGASFQFSTTPDSASENVIEYASMGQGVCGVVNGTPIACSWVDDDDRNIIYAAHMVLNADLPWTTFGSLFFSRFDVQNAVTHEFGHWLKLLDLKDTQCTDATMYWSGGKGETKKRTLADGDIEGIRYIYPAGCFPNLPAPQLSVVDPRNAFASPPGQWLSLYSLSVDNADEYPAELFAAAPELPACGANANASRTWVDIYDQNGNRIYGYCGLQSPEELSSMMVSFPAPGPVPSALSIKLVDRQCNATYASNQAAVPPPPPVSVAPSGGTWTESPQRLSLQSGTATAIYYTMVNTYDGSTPTDPPTPTPTANNGMAEGGAGFVGYIDLFASAGQYKRTKVRFVGCNSLGCGQASGPFSYTLDLRYPGNVFVSPSTGSWTSSPQTLFVGSSRASRIYYTMVNTYDGSTPANPGTPSPSSNDGSIAGPSNSFVLFAEPGQQKRSKLRFVGCDGSNCGAVSGVFEYRIDLR